MMKIFKIRDEIIKILILIILQSSSKFLSISPSPRNFFQEYPIFQFSRIVLHITIIHSYIKSYLEDISQKISYIKYQRIKTFLEFDVIHKEFASV